MRNIILDSNIILKYPKILGLSIPNINFVVPIDIVEELSYRASQRGDKDDKRIDLLQQASQEGTISIINTDLPVFRQQKQLINNAKLSLADSSLLAVALNLKDKNEIVEIATQDKDVWKIAQEYNIPILDSDRVEEFINSFSVEKTNSVQANIKKYSKEVRLKLITSILTGLITAIIGNISYINFSFILKSINVWGTITLIIIVGILLFIFREKQKLSYGIFEFLVGIFAIIMIFQPIKFDYSKISFDLDFGIRLLGGLYIMVRGQDNIVKALKDHRIGIYLNEKFGIGK